MRDWILHDFSTPMNKLLVHACLLGLFSLLLIPSAAAQDVTGDAEAGRIRAYTCTGCHGIPDYNNVYPTYRVPKVAGQNALYIVNALNAYKAGTRKHPTMQIQAESMTEEDIANVAVYFSSLGKEQ